MDFFKNVTARVGDLAAKAGDLLLDSESDDEDDVLAETKAPSDGFGGGDETRGSRWHEDGRRADSTVDDTQNADEEEDDDDDEAGAFVPQAVWQTLRLAKDKLTHAAKTTVASVSRDVHVAAETVRRDLNEFRETTDEGVSSDIVFVGDALGEFAAGGSGGLGVSRESDGEDGSDDGDDGDDDDDDRRASTRLDPHVVDTFERTAEALEQVGETMERFGATMFQNAGRLFDKIVDKLDDAADATDSTGRRHISSTVDTQQGKHAASSLADNRTSDQPRASVQSPRDAALAVFEKKVAAAQRDSGTYCDEPEDGVSFQIWQKTFHPRSESTKNSVDALLGSNSFMKTMSVRIVPAVVEYDVFWSRYFFRVYALRCERDGHGLFEDEEGEGDEEEGNEGTEDGKEEEKDKGKAEGKKADGDDVELAETDTAGDATFHVRFTSPNDDGARSGSDTRRNDQDGSADTSKLAQHTDVSPSVSPVSVSVPRRGAPTKERREDEEEEETESEPEPEPEPTAKTHERMDVGETNDPMGNYPPPKEAQEIEPEDSKTHERVDVGDPDPMGNYPPGHHRVVSLATTDGTDGTGDGSDDSLGKDWTRMRDVEYSSGGGSSSGETGEAPVADSDAPSARTNRVTAIDPVTTTTALQNTAPPVSPQKPADAEDSDLDEDWGMDSD